MSPAALGECEVSEKVAPLWGSHICPSTLCGYYIGHVAWLLHVAPRVLLRSASYPR